MTSFYKLQRHWQEWGDKLEPIVKSKSARLNFPSKLREVSSDATSWVLAPERPICITNAPMRSSSKRSRDHLKLALFINGDLKVPKDPSNPCITHSCNLTIFRYDEVPNKSASLFMVDALHFDVDNVSTKTKKRTPFHPIFHVQRSLKYDDSVFKNALAEVLHLNADAITVDQTNKAALGTPYLRLPTPQLDMFSVITLIAADYFCDPADVEGEDEPEADAQGKARKTNAGDRSNAKALFVALLDLLKSHANFAREGSPSLELRDRLQKADVFSTACWYPESA